MELRFRKLNDRSKPIHISVIKYGLGFGRVQAVLGFRERFSDEVAQEAAEPAYTSHFLSCTLPIDRPSLNKMQKCVMRIS